MLLHGFLSAVLGKTKHRPVKLKNIQLIAILMCILTIPEIAHAANFENKAVFSAPCVDVMSSSTHIPELTQLTVCTYIKLASSDPWTAFTYQLPTSSTNIYEFGVLGDSSSLKIWMFGTQINVLERLNLHTWYEICIIWDGKNESMGFYVNGTQKVHRKLENKANLVGGGRVMLGCSQFKEINATASVGLIGEMYLFRMWNTSQTSLFQKCQDGNIIKWKKDNWIYSSSIAQKDSTLYCANAESEAPTSGQINNNIHLFHKRALEVAVDSSSAPSTVLTTNRPTTALLGKSTGAAQVDSTATNILTSDFNTFSTKDTTNITNATEFTIGTSKSTTLWKLSSSSTGNDTFSNSSTFSTSSFTTNLNNGTSSWSSDVTSRQTYLTSSFRQITNGLTNQTSTMQSNTVSSNVTTGFTNQTSTMQSNTITSNVTEGLTNQTSTMQSNTVSSNVTAGSLNCSVNDTTAFQNWQSDICNTTCDYGSAYEIIPKVCSQLNIMLIRFQNTQILNYTKVITKDCMALIIGINNSEICDILINNGLFSKLTINKLDYYCCCKEECSSPNCIVSTPVCEGGSGSSVTIGFQSTTFNNNGLTTVNGSSMTIYGGPSTTSTKGSSTTFNSDPFKTGNVVSNAPVDSGLSTTIDGKSNTTTKKEVTVNNKFDTTLNAVTNLGSTTVNSEVNATSGNGMTTIKRELNGTDNTSYTSNSGSMTTIDSGTQTTVKNGPSTTLKNYFNTTVYNEPTSTTNSGSNSTVNTGSMTSSYGFNTTVTRTVTRNTTLNTGPMSTFHGGAEPTDSNNDSITITSVSIGSDLTTKSSNTTDMLKNFTRLLGSDNLNETTVSSIVSQLQSLVTGEVNREDAVALLDVLNSFLNVSQTLLGPVSNSLIKIVDTIGLQLTFPGQSINLTTQFLALAVNKVNDSTFTGASFGVEVSSGLQVSLGSQLPSNSDGSILLPASVISELSPGEKYNASRIQFNYYAKASFFQDSSLPAKKHLVSTVISSSVANLSLTNLSENITVILKTPSRNSSVEVECVFWDFNKNNQSGGWSSYGCLVANTTQNETICKCNHLTSFAILMNVSPNDHLQSRDLLVLTFITYIGCGLSAIFLSVTLITYIAFEKIRRDYPSKILIQLCAALVCLNLTFLLNPWIALYNDIPGLCISVAAFLHYFVLVSITWMGLEAFHMYLSLVKVFNTYVRKYILKFCIIGWGVPAVVVAIILAVNKDLYSLKISGTYPNGSADYFCWVNDIVFWITIVGYFGIIFLLNVSMFVVVLIQLCRIKRQKQLGYQRKTTLQDLRSVAGITFLLGITWGLGFFSFGPGKTVIMYLFTIFNSLQGFFIFFFYCVAKENVRKQWRRYLCCGRFRLAENSDWSKTATNKLRKQTSKQGVSSSSSNSIQSNSNTNSTTLLVSNEYSLHPNGNGNILKERNGVSFMLQNGEMALQEFAGRPSTKNGDLPQNSVRRTSNRGSVHFIDQI